MTGRSAGCAVGEQLRLFPLPPPFWVSLLPATGEMPTEGGVTPGRDGRRARRSRAAADGQRCVEGVGRVLAMYVPGSMRGADPAVVAEVLDAARAWVAAAEPRDGAAARQMVWALAPMLVWLRRRLGSLDVAMLNERNVEVWVCGVNKYERKEGWRHLVRGCLRRVGRVVNPDGWARSSGVIGRSPVARPYDPSVESVFGQVAALPRPGDRAGRLWVAAGGFGGGLSGVEMLAAETGDLRELGGGRLAVQVRGRDPRLVPIRACWTEAVRRAAHLAQQRHGSGAGCRFVHAVDKNAVSRLAAGLDFGQGGLSLRRARATWLTAHLLAGTPWHALRAISGSLSAQTLAELVELAAAGTDPGTAVSEGLRI